MRHSVKENVLSDPTLVTDKDCEEFLTIRGKGWVCEIDSQIVGFSIADLVEDNIWALFVRPEFEKKGIGKKLHDLMLDWYFSNEKSSVWLGTESDSRAEQFYRACGWTRVGIRSNGELKFELSSDEWKKLRSINQSTAQNNIKMEENYLESVRKQFEYYKMLGERTFDQLNEEDFFWHFNPDSNSIAIIVKHLWGNMRSRWTDFLTTDGEKEWRNRDSEFVADLKCQEEVMKKWKEGWDFLFKALDSINHDNFNTLIYIRNMEHTIVDAVNRQLAHYAYHAGQIVFIGTMIRGDDWKSLSIPKGQSTEFNQEKFSKPKRK